MTSEGGASGNSALQQLVQATFAIYYHTEWQARGLADPAKMDPRIRPLAFEDATRRLVEDGSRDDFRYRSAALTLSIAQLVRASSPTRLDRSRVSAARTLTQHWSSLHCEYRAEVTEEVQAAAKQPDPLLRLLFRPDLRLENQRFAHAFDVLNRGQGAPASVRHFAESWSYDHRVSDICVSIESTKSLADLQGLLEPRAWRVNVPLVWEQSDPLLDDTLFIEANAPQAFGPVAPDLPPYGGKLHEVALFGLSPFEFARYRNLLNVDIDVNPAKRAKLRPSIIEPPGCEIPPNDRLEFRYSQNVCLRTSLNAIASFPNGGIDVDRGFGRCEKLPAPAGETWTRIKARKRARFDQPDIGLLNVIYNDIAAVYLKLLIEAFVLFGAVI